MIHEIAPHRLDSTYIDRPPCGTDIVLHYQSDKVLLKEEDGQLALPTIADVQAVFSVVGRHSDHLFSIDGQGFFLVTDPRAATAPRCVLRSTQVFRELAPQHMAFAGITGSQLNRWMVFNRFCGRCGGRMRKGLSERSLSARPAITPSTPK
jgi:NAD+ diphosphatase